MGSPGGTREGRRTLTATLTVAQTGTHTDSDFNMFILFCIVEFFFFALIVIFEKYYTKKFCAHASPSSKTQSHSIVQ